MTSVPARSLQPLFDDDLLLEEGAQVVHVCLNRPGVLNALSASIIKGLGHVLDIAGPRTVLVYGAGGRAFCAGGDIKAQVNAIKAGQLAGVGAYFADEYALNAKLFAHRSGSYVSYLNGIVMGGGYGISAHGSHLVTCEATQFAMPEVKIGFFPDVGAVYHLARLGGDMGTYLAMTGNTIGPADMLALGLAQAHVPLATFARLQVALTQGDAGAVLLGMHAAPEDDVVLMRHQDVVARCFAFDSAEAIVDALLTDGRAFALETAAQIAQRSPTSVKVALGHIRMARGERFDAVIARDLRLVRQFMTLADFPEGVRAAVIDKDRNPRWSPATLAEVDDSMVALYLSGSRS